jgi:hypothetical protein
MQLACWALRLALARAGKSIAARMAMIAITTSNSIRVKPRVTEGLARFTFTRVDIDLGFEITPVFFGYGVLMA